MELFQRVAEIYKRMSHAAMRAGRRPDAASLVAVTKTMPAAAVREAYDAGLREFGESRLQEAVPKAGELGGMSITWHMVGHLQRNKARAAVGMFDLIHSVDSVALLRDIGRHAASLGKLQRVLLQVKLSDEAGKHGADERAIEEMLAEAESIVSVRVEGLMTVPPYFDDPDLARPYFRRLAELGERYGLRELSMGMTGDFEVAIEEGATIIRVGTAIFGEREYA